MVSRITQQILNRNLLGQIQARQADIFRAQRQIGTGLRYERPSEDPLAASVGLNLSQAIAFQNRVEKNAQLAQDFNYAAEVELQSGEQVLQRVRELAIRAASEALNEQQLEGFSSELNGLLERMTDLANATHEGRFLFGGYQSQQPPFVSERNLVLEGTSMTELGLSSGTFRTQLQTRSVTTVQAGAFALNGGDLVINNVDIGSLAVNDGSRTDLVNAQTLVDLINAKTAETGVTARAVSVQGGTFNNPNGTGGPLNGIALSNLDSNGQPTANGIQVGGRGIAGAGNLPLFRRETLPLDDTRFTSERLAAGAIGNVPAGTVSINGVAINSAMTFVAGNTPEQNAQEIARAINTISSQSQVYAETDGYGYLKLVSQQPFTIAGAPAQLQLPNQLYSQTRNAAASTAAVTAAGGLTLSSGSLLINGIDIFQPPVQLTASMTAQQRADAVVRAINTKANESGISAARDANGQIFFSNSNRQVTGVSYRGDSGENRTQIGRQELLELNISGDQAFAGNRREITLVSDRNLPAVGLGSAISTAPVSFQAGDSLAAGQFTINGTDILVPGPLTGVPATDAATLIAAINGQTATTNVQAVASGPSGVELRSTNGNAFTLATAGTGTRANIPAGSYLNGIAAGDLLINGVDVGPIPAVPANPGNPVQNAQDLGNALVTAINNQAALTGVRAELLIDNLGNARLQLNTTGQDIDISSTNPGVLPANILNATGLTPGSRTQQRIDVFEAIIQLRDQVFNAKYQRTATSISQQNIKDISDALDVLVGKQVDLGVRANRAELVASRTALNREVLENQLADNQGVDITEAIIDFENMEQSLQAAYSITQRINGLSLLNFI